MSESSLVIHPTATIFVGVTLIGAILAVTLRNILHSIFGLAIALFGLAALFLYLGSPFVAAMQVLIYVGGISVAMVFAVMFSYRLDLTPESPRRRIFALVSCLVYFGALALVLRGATFGQAGPDRDWSVEAMGRALLNHYNVVFEALSVVLLLAIAGAIVIARKSRSS